MKQRIKMYTEEVTEVAVLTKEGNKLIGIIVPEELVKYNLPTISLLTANQQGIFLKRKKHLTFLDENNIVSIRSAKIGEKEK